MCSARWADAPSWVERRHEEYNLQQGWQSGRWSLKKNIAHAAEKLGEAWCQILQAISRMCVRLGWQDTLQEAVFSENQRARPRRPWQESSISKEASRNSLVKSAGRWSQSKQDLANDIEQIKELKARPNSNIDPAYQACATSWLRVDLCRPSR